MRGVTARNGGTPGAFWQGACPVFAQADACRSRFCLPFAVYCRAGVYGRRRGWRRQTGSRRAKSPALHCARGRAAAQERRQHVRADGGLVRESPPAQGSAACRSRFLFPFAVYCRAGVHARHVALRRRKATWDDAGIVHCGEAGQGGVPVFAGYLRRKPAMHPSVCALRRIRLPLLGRLWGDCRLKGSPARGCGVERRLRRRTLFLIRQTAVTPFIIACSAIESIGPPFAHRSGLCRFTATQRSQNASVLQHTQRDAGTASR